jgi:hypothetical protein
MGNLTGALQQLCADRKQAQARVEKDEAVRISSLLVNERPNPNLPFCARAETALDRYRV